MGRRHDSSTERSTPPSGLRVGLAIGAGIGAFAAFLFIPAGRLDWGAGWVYLSIFSIYILANYAYLRRWNPEVIEHRLRLGKGTKTWDIIWAVAFTPLFLAVFIVAGMEAGRLGGYSMPLWLWPVGLALFLAGAVLLTWAMGVNPFFEKTVRIQTDRGHRVIDTGPYRFVRHPGYVGFFGWIVSTPLLLGSWWAFLPAILSVVALIVRTILEDRTLCQELRGYAAYASRVRYRLIPGLW